MASAILYAIPILYKWQMAVILDILKEVDIVIYISTSLGKSLSF